MTQQEIGPDEAVQRLVAKLTNPRAVFTSSQVAFLMGTAGRWARETVDDEPGELSYRAGYQNGYQARIAEENAAHQPEPMLVGGQWMERVDHRRRCDREARIPRKGDMPGSEA